MSEVRSTWKCHWVLILIVTLMVSGLVNIITISLLGTWECPKNAIQAQEVHDVHRNVGLITIDESLGDNDLTAPHPPFMPIYWKDCNLSNTRRRISKVRICKYSQETVST